MRTIVWNVRDKPPTALLEGKEWRKVSRGQGLAAQPTDTEVYSFAKKKPEAY
jgi:hypothetical protein